MGCTHSPTVRASQLSRAAPPSIGIRSSLTRPAPACIPLARVAPRAGEGRIATRVYVISDPPRVADPSYLHSLHSALAAVLDYALAVVEPASGAPPASRRHCSRRLAWPLAPAFRSTPCCVATSPAMPSSATSLSKRRSAPKSRRRPSPPAAQAGDALRSPARGGERRARPRSEELAEQLRGAPPRVRQGPARRRAGRSLPARIRPRRPPPRPDGQGRGSAGGDARAGEEARPSPARRLPRGGARLGLLASAACDPLEAEQACERSATSPWIGCS